MISIILILLFVFSVLSVPVCHGVISGLYLYGMKIFPGLFISFILTNILVRILQQKNINNPWILVITGLMTGFPNGAYICDECVDVCAEIIILKTDSGTCLPA